MQYRVIGARTIAGVAPGGTVEFGEDTTVDVTALVEAGHVALVAEDDGELKPLDQLTVSELRSYAESHDIDLGDARLKADVLAAIRHVTNHETEEEA